jgi:hypothetical protein
MAFFFIAVLHFTVTVGPSIMSVKQPLAGLFTYVNKPYICASMFIFLWMTYDMHLYVLSLLVILHIMLVKSPLGLVLYCYFNMPTINKLILSYLILPLLASNQFTLVLYINNILVNFRTRMFQIIGKSGIPVCCMLPW